MTIREAIENAGYTLDTELETGDWLCNENDDTEEAKNFYFYLEAYEK